jgi:urease alpha subunit
MLSDFITNVIKAFNSASSQVWAATLLFGGVGVFVIACFCRPQDARAALLSAGTTMVGGGIGMFQHQAASDKAKDPSAAQDAPPK